MNHPKKSKTSIRKEALKLLNEGQSKQETYQLLSSKFGLDMEVAEVLKGIPSKRTFAKFAFGNYLLLCMLLGLLVFFFSLKDISTYAWHIFLLTTFSYFVFTKRVTYYPWISGMTIIALIIYLVLSFTEDSNFTSTAPFYFILAAFIPYLILPIWLSKKLCPEPLEIKTTYHNESGQLKGKITYTFED
jgi:hypothetical protein